MKKMITIAGMVLGLTAGSLYAGCCGDADAAGTTCAAKKCPIATATATAATTTTAASAKTAAPAKTQSTCPVMGGEVDKKLYVDADGKRIYVCCTGCLEKVKADPGKYIKLLEAQGVVLDKTPTK